MKKSLFYLENVYIFYDHSTRIMCWKRRNIFCNCKHVTFGDIEANPLNIIEDLNCKLRLLFLKHIAIFVKI